MGTIVVEYSSRFRGGQKNGRAEISAGVVVSEEEGAELEEREAAASGRARPRPHIRRAHWHTFLAGADRMERRLKWLPPIPVNVADVSDLPATIRRAIDE